jgi:hypothetical protein
MPFHAIIIPLSVQSLGGGTTNLKFILSHTRFRCFRMNILLATPPDTTYKRKNVKLLFIYLLFKLANVRFISGKSFVRSINSKPLCNRVHICLVIAYWKLAHKS